MHLTPKSQTHESPQVLKKDSQSKANRKLLWDTVICLGGILVAALFSVVAMGVVLAPSVNPVGFWSRLAWFIGGIVLLQMVLMLIVFQIRKRNRPILELQQRLADAYLTSLDNSKLNPNHPQSS
ncbi:MAG TPA: hypothetical protein VFY60_16225 [Pyrinomonadaceae bacterium]|nr:hypothetical protein [Pyrinomonadaceae bacterium]